MTPDEIFKYVRQVVAHLCFERSHWLLYGQWTEELKGEGDILVIQVTREVT